ncbi:MAG: M15 family metallopeptidase [Oscillospiraceae bacterium]|nr:M15 family metallopeptidase [Oscillospiraceae bacterium]
MKLNKFAAPRAVGFILAAVFLLAPLSIARAAEQPFRVVINSVVTDVKAVKTGGGLYLEARRMLENFGVYLFWNNTTKTIAMNTRDGVLATHVVGTSVISVNGTLTDTGKASKSLPSGDTYMPLEMINAVLRPGAQQTAFNALYYYRRFTKDEVISAIQQQIGLLDNYNPLHFTRYIAYAAANRDTPPDKVILYVNCNVDLAPYSEIEVLTNEYSPYVLVDKFHKLPEGFMPELGNYGGYQWVKEAGEAWLAMKAAAKADGYTLGLDNTYRDYATQNYLWSRRENERGRGGGDKDTARAGHSEHNLGFCADLAGMSGFSDSSAFSWFDLHGHEYGFIVSYTQDKQFIHRYIVEPWHIRWYPQEAADIMWAENLTITEYDNLYLRPKAHGFTIDRETVRAMSRRDFTVNYWTW